MEYIEKYIILQKYKEVDILNLILPFNMTSRNAIDHFNTTYLFKMPEYSINRLTKRLINLQKFGKNQEYRILL
jgi:hypothetical protein